MAGWADDPELLATFRAEVDERVASLQSGLLALETTANPRSAVATLFRDAHTVKGSARMLGLGSVVQVAHRAEDLLGAIRDGRFEARRDLVDLLLAACDAMSGAMPGVADPVPAAPLSELADAIQRALDGDESVTVPSWTPVDDIAAVEDDPAEDLQRRGVE